MRYHVNCVAGYGEHGRAWEMVTDANSSFEAIQEALRRMREAGYEWYETAGWSFH